jgi:dTDP-4-dehydrorhamnose reductase
MIIITGGNGQLGQALQQHAPSWAEVNAIDVEDCDLADIPMLRARLVVEAPDVIINTAACRADDPAETDMGYLRAVNADAVAAMVEAVDQTGGKLVQISTNLVFDGSSSRPYRPYDVRVPICAYGQSKAESEDHLRKHDLLIRTGLIYSAGHHNFVRSMITLMNDREEIDVPAGTIGALTWASGLARTVWSLIAQGANGIYHHGDEGVASWEQIAAVIAEEAHALGLIRRIPAIRTRPDHEPPALALPPVQPPLDCHATRALLDDEPIHWREALRQMLHEEAGLR